jgi:hypothetical protein
VISIIRGSVAWNNDEYKVIKAFLTWQGLAHSVPYEHQTKKPYEIMVKCGDQVEWGFKGLLRVVEDNALWRI